ncbi:MAG: acylneuraminate cytidylyltransferase family protein [Rhodothermales bacterium]|nr:acylneuraminate cytidylyltransferase family protein [Rhodothermales bacterium]
MSNILCLIPARGGSRRVPRKNVLPLAGKPLLAYTLEAAIDSGVFADVVVSSDDAEILAVAREWGAGTDERAASLAGDTVPMVRVAEEYLRRDGMNTRYDHVAVMLPTCPFRTAEDVRRAAALYARQTGDVSLIAVTNYEFPPQLAMTIAEDAGLAMREPETYLRTTRSQSIDTAYHPNGALYMASVTRFLANGTFFHEPMVGYAMPPERSLDIDYPYQFQMAEALMQERLATAESESF